MIPFLTGFFTFLNAFFRSRYSLGLEIVALRQQLISFLRIGGLHHRHDWRQAA